MENRLQKKVDIWGKKCKNDEYFLFFVKKFYCYNKNSKKFPFFKIATGKY